MDGRRQSDRGRQPILLRRRLQSKQAAARLCRRQSADVIQGDAGRGSVRAGAEFVRPEIRDVRDLQRSDQDAAARRAQSHRSALCQRRAAARRLWRRPGQILTGDRFAPGRTK